MLLAYDHQEGQSPAPLESWDSPPVEPTVWDSNRNAGGANDDQLIYDSTSRPCCALHVQALPLLLARASWRLVHTLATLGVPEGERDQRLH